jgi:hypothetical protein
MVVSTQDVFYLQKNNHLGFMGWLSVGTGMLAVLIGCMLAVAGMQLSGLFCVFNGTVALNLAAWLFNARVHKNTVIMLSRLSMLDDIGKR